MNIAQNARLIALSGVAVCALSLSNPLAAEEVGQWYLTPMISFIDDAPKRGVDDDFNGGSIALGKVLRNDWRVELGLFGADLKDSSAGNDQTMRGLGADLMRRFETNTLFSPYLLGGLGYMDTQYDKADDENNLVASLGAGVLAHIGDNGWAIRAEARLRSVIGDQTLNDMWYSAGLQIPLGKKAAPMPKDSDRDGVYDKDDRCPGTAAGVTVDTTGCAIVVKKMDSDKDGVEDQNDACPNTPMGIRVDSRGCERDSDGDGVVDSKDRCPNTARNVRVDVNGCEIKQRIELPGVQFEKNSATLKAESSMILNEAAATLKKYPDIRVEVAGHTDASGPAGYNLELSQRRAEAVASYLAGRGVSKSRLQTKGYGENEPRTSNDTEAGRTSNRRVELRILSN